MKITTPQFTRPKSEPGPSAPPVGKDKFDALKSMSDIALKEMGLQKWGRMYDSGHESTDSGPMLWLYPGEWYSSIPNGYPIVDINFNEEKFCFGITDDDVRFGCLSYGFLKE